MTAQEDGARVRVTRPAVQVDLAAARKSDTPFYEPEVWSPGGKHILHVQPAQLPLRGVDDGKPGRVEVLTYNGKLVGPTIRVRRGERFTVRVVNDLQGPEPFAKVYSNLPAGSPVDPKDPERKQIDPPHGLYTTNLHTHGLHVSPVGKADDVFVEIAPGKSRDFVYQVPADHPAGTFWYHPHKHGSVGYQLASGMAGALIVEGDPAAGFTDLEAVPAIAAAKERVFVLQQLALRVAPQGIGWVYPDDVYNGEDNATPDKPDGILKLPGQPAYQTTTVNGVVMPTVRLRPGEVQRWRFVHAG
ncbi:MAG: multicopper oxidase domain-containing protein, partial [Zavarzinella sp.]|nr:multicopper oxidase domain-containing protein [Zavarzinella sp.]